MIWVALCLVHLIGWITLSWVWFFGVLALDFAVALLFKEKL